MPVLVMLKLDFFHKQPRVGQNRVFTGYFKVTKLPRHISLCREVLKLI